MRNDVIQYQMIERKTGELACFVAGLAWGLYNETDEEFMARCHTIERLAREIENDTSVLREWKEQDRRGDTKLTEKDKSTLSKTQLCLGDERA